MSEKNNILGLCVCMALCDHKLNKDETAEILKIAKELKTDLMSTIAPMRLKKNFQEM